MSDPAVPQKAPYVKEVQPGTYFWCACGLSKSQPFCDGSHATGSTRTPVQVTVDQPTKIAFCGCKHSANGFRCDGTHRKF